MSKRKINGPTSQIVADNIVKLRKNLGLTIPVAAERCRMEPAELKLLEDGIGIFDNAVNLLKVAEGYRVSYQQLFYNDAGRDLLNAKVPVEVYKWIRQTLKDRSVSVSDFCKMIGCQVPAFYYWVSGQSNSSVLLFENIISLLQLTSIDLEKMLPAKPAPEEKPLPEPKDEFIQSEETTREGPKKMREEDRFEERMLKIMRLQRNLDDVLDKLKLITVTAFELHSQLEELKGA